MKGRILTIIILFSMLWVIATWVFYTMSAPVTVQDKKGQQIVALNEIEKLAENGELDKMSAKVAQLQEEIRTYQVVTDDRSSRFLMCGMGILFVFVIFFYVYFSILRPFDRMKGFAKDIAQGNFEVPLDYERSNYFGAFTWAFDSMRREIVKARACEREAIENNKTVIATLSHDIKTPIASIRAYAEGLEAHMDTSMEKRQRYLDVIMKKCDEVSRLTNDLFLHSLSDLEKLKINLEKAEVCALLKTVISELSAEQNDIEFVDSGIWQMVWVDKNRFTQLVENLINNARKYAKTDIQVRLEREGDQVHIGFRDYGPGIPDEDMPFILDKFYRGKNCGDEPGSGLGLYIVRYIAEQMKGNVVLHNHADGLEVIVSFPLCS